MAPNLSSKGTPRRHAQLWAALTAIAGVIALGTALAFQALPQVTAAGACLSGEGIFRFEVARTLADLEAVFGPPAGDCREKVVAAMDAVNTLDVLLFIPAYAAFLAFAGIFLAGGLARPLAQVAIGAAMLALVADYVETFSLLSYTPDLTPTLARLAQSSAAAWLKFLGLGVNGLVLAALCFTAAPNKRWILGSVLCLPAIGVAMMFVDLRWASVQTLTFLAAWTLLVAFAVRSAIWSKDR